MDKVNIEELKKINQRYLGAHYQITEQDLKNIEHLTNLIEFTRDSLKPKKGDIVKFTSEYGDYYDNAIISNVWSDGDIEICECPYTPFVGTYNSITKDIGLSVSGGKFHNIEQKIFEYIGKDKRKFCAWGSCKACADGAIDFMATVNVWQVKLKNKYEPYTTKEYNKMHIQKEVHIKHIPYTILGEGIAFETEEEYKIFLKTYRAKEFLVNGNNSYVIFFYKEENFYVSKEEWNNLQDCEIDTRRDNGSIITVKVQYDEANKKIKVYRYSNSFEPKEEIADKSYILNRDNINIESK